MQVLPLRTSELQLLAQRGFHPHQPLTGKRSSPFRHSLWHGIIRRMSGFSADVEAAKLWWVRLTSTPFVSQAFELFSPLPW